MVKDEASIVTITVDQDVLFAAHGVMWREASRLFEEGSRQGDEALKGQARELWDTCDALAAAIRDCREVGG